MMTDAQLRGSSRRRRSPYYCPTCGVTVSLSPPQPGRDHVCDNPDHDQSVLLPGSPPVNTTHSGS